MKNLQVTLVALSLIALVTACRPGGRHVVISDGDKLKIEYRGRVNFTDDQSAIKSITPNGSAHYVHDGEEILAESDKHGIITYQINDGPRQDKLDSIGRKLLAKAIKVMIQRGHYNN